TAENDYTKAKTKHLDTFIDKLFNEMKNRIKEDDESVPYKYKDYYYYNRNEKDKEYKIYCRKHLSLESEEEILLDLNKMSEGLEYYKIQTMKISPNQKLLAFSEDKTGYEKFVIFVKNLETGEISATRVDNIGWNFEWADDNTLYYTLRDEAQRPYALKKHVLGTSAEQDTLVFEENDTKRRVSVWKGNDRKYLFMNSESTLSSEIRLLDLNDPHGDFVVFLPREEKHEYSIAHKDGYFYVTTNTDECTNFKLIRTPIDRFGKENWEEIIDHDENVRLLGSESFDDFHIIHKRTEGLPRMEIFYNKEDERNHDIQLPEPVYGVWSGANAEYSTDFYRLRYTSLITPMSTFDYFVKEKKLELKKEEEVKNYNKEDYVTERRFVKARDGAKIPISIVHKKGIKQPAPTMIYGYGAYGHSMDTYFSPRSVSLIERGVIYVIAHVRGGGELGRPWYENGKFLKKKNTFNDFIDCSKYLIDEKITTRNQLIAMGGSAGGLLMGAIMNMNPELFHLIIARVPFIDVINTMLDESIPLTSEEWEEWGDPRDKVYFDYMLSYSPYDNIEAKDYPHILVTAGLNDPRVHYWEPAKLVAKLRVLKTDDNELILKTNMGAGHSGASGRYEAMKELAFVYACALDKVSLVDN
ncbi:MAG: S9 family peptidase, partial [Candidatus Heimdallarchaeota archaeon]|nr:S9 family peptidase [Candidatus Heimdallarchaeota archaeon]MCK4876262.1 S9 family peptidase [Candidatus Heimdallarchaeota archaeon]